MVVFAGLVVPGNDPITMLALAIALILLYELSVQVTRVHDKRAGKKAGLAELADDEASALPIPLADDPAASRDLRGPTGRGRRGPSRRRSPHGRPPRRRSGPTCTVTTSATRPDARRPESSRSGDACAFTLRGLMFSDELSPRIPA